MHKHRVLYPVRQKNLLFGLRNFSCPQMYVWRKTHNSHDDSRFSCHERIPWKTLQNQKGTGRWTYGRTSSRSNRWEVTRAARVSHMRKQRERNNLVGQQKMIGDVEKPCHHHRHSCVCLSECHVRESWIRNQTVNGDQPSSVHCVTFNSLEKLSSFFCPFDLPSNPSLKRTWC